MKNIFTLTIFTLLFLPCLGKTLDKPQEYNTMLRGNGMEFIENKGQIVDQAGHVHPDIFYVGDGGGAKIYLRNSGVSYVVTKIEGREEEKHHDKVDDIKERQKMFAHAMVKGHRVDMEYKGSNVNAKRIEGDAVEGYFNYYVGHCPGGITNIHSYNKVVYQEVYKKIDVAYYGGKEKGLKYDIIVRPGGNVEDIVMKYNGASDVQLVSGRLKISTSVGELAEWLPKIYQNVDGCAVEVSGTYELQGEEVRFKVDDYDKSKELIIDPWITYYGGSDIDQGHDIATDMFGNVVVTGYTSSVNFPVSPGAFQTTFGGVVDVFVVKFDREDKRLWATYYGGSSGDAGYGVSTDKSGNVLVAGYTESMDFPATSGSFKGLQDAFVVKLDSSGKRLWATYCGGTSYDYAYGIATDNSNNVVMTGYTYSVDFPVTSGAFQTIYGGGIADVFVVEFNSAGTYMWATYYGGADGDGGQRVSVDKSDNVLITGITNSPNFPVTSNAFQPKYGGQTGARSVDAFAVKFNKVGGRLWATYCGGNADDFGYGIATDRFDNVVITGTTQSDDFPVTQGAFKTTRGTSLDAFVVKFDSGGKCLWSTFLGGPYGEDGNGIAIDSSNNIYIVGDNDGGGFPVTTCAYQSIWSGGNKVIFIFKFDPDDKRLQGTYVGSAEYSSVSGKSIALFGSSLYVSGITNGFLPVTQNAFQEGYGGGGSDAFIARLCANSFGANENVTIDFSASKKSIVAGERINFFAQESGSMCDSIGIHWQWFFSGAAPSTSAAKDPQGILYATPGTYSVKLVATACGKDSIIKNDYIVVTQSAGVDDEDHPLSVATLEQNYPNPAHIKTTFPIAAENNPYIRLEVYDMFGRQVEVLHDGNLPEGNHEITINTGAFTNGIYFCRMIHHGHITTKAFNVER